MTFISGSFHHLRNCLTNDANIRLLRFYSGKSLSGRFRCKNRPLTTRAEVTRERPLTGTPQSINLHISQAEILNPHIEPIECYPAVPKEGVLEGKTDRPATILVFDLETTGANKHDERIIEIAVRDLMGGRNSTFQTLINPLKKVNFYHIHHISDEMVKQPGIPRMEDVAPILKEWVQSVEQPGKPVIWVAHNGKTFDFPFFIREMDRCGYKIPDHWRFFDTLPFARQIVDSNGLKLKGYSVESLCKFFGIDVEGTAHRAMVDVNRLSDIYQRATFHLEFTTSDMIKQSLTASEIKWKPQRRTN